MDGTMRRESRIPKPSLAVSSGRAALGDKQNTLSQKRRGAPLETVPEPKRTTAPAAAASGSGPAATGPVAGEESWQDIAERTGMAPEDVLSRRLVFKKGTLPAKKLEEMAPVIKELKALGWHLKSEHERAALDAQQWKSHGEELQRAAEAKAEEVAGQEAAARAQVEEAKAALSKAEAAGAGLQERLSEAEARLAERDAELSEARRALEGREGELEKAAAQVEERDAKIREMEEVVRQSQRYSSTLQGYNTSLQNDITAEKARRDEAVRAREELQGQVAELGGLVRSGERMLALEKEAAGKLREEREAVGREVAVLRMDLDATRADRERITAEAKELKEELERIREAGGRSAETMEAIANSKATLEAQLTSQRALLDALRSDLGAAREHQALAESLADSRGRQLDELKSQLSTLQSSLEDAERRVFESELIRRKLHNTIQELKGNIRVFCRVRPALQSELEAAGSGTEPVATSFPTAGDLLGRGVEIVVPGNLSGQAPQKHSFGFDKVFAPTATQESVFEEISELVQSALDGHKVCIFAYGQTGSGKTYTMLGSESQRGIIPRAIQQIFEGSRALGTQGWMFTMQASMLEIYNEEYKDLLARGKGTGKKHNVVHDASGVTTVSDLTLVDVDGPSAVQSLLSRAMEKRSVGCTAMNEQSSRSHMVFSLRIDGVNASSQLKVGGVLNLIDLAGSERVKESGATGVRLTEAQNINKSLSALGDVIFSLANKDKHVPFRNSKLTWLLQPCLGGDAKTLMFVNVSPATEYANESLCSLRFASKVNACEIGTARRNVKTA
ncbi:kinesin [Raphidocelis subcapitata]|uniref:Kinesin-like protein n=1 Tax=Raphidocelis subcapitata TaxID=307507 RepID=A0A2V0NS90_9CHLO|nr:kinesin [Raphidocelis subcapitata]|eukprot:GBF87705.1 kinesin [Raphidocelis subcapitata]